LHGDKIDKKSISFDHYLHLVPKRNCRWYISKKTGRCVIRIKRFKKEPSLYQRILLKLFHRNEYIKIFLDDYGSDVFRFINSKNDIKTIANKIKFKNKRDGKNINFRLISFILNLESNGLIVLLKPKTDKNL